MATMAGGKYHIIGNGALLVREGKILWAGPREDLPETLDKEKANPVDCENKWLLPGLVDCHTHLVWGGSRANEFEMRLKGATYEEIALAGGGISSTVKATRAASEEELFSRAARRMENTLRQGITTLEIKSGYGLELETELKMLRVMDRLHREYPLHIEPTFLGAHALPPEFKGRSGEYIDLVTQTMLPAVKDQGIATAVDVFCEAIAFSREETRKVFQAATDLGLRIKLHAEQLSDSDGAALAAEFNALSCDHIEYLSFSGAKKMAEKKVAAVLLPGAFYFLKEKQAPPIAYFRDLNIPMALSTDLNPGTSPVHSLLLIMNMGCLLFGLTCEEALAGTTINAARALGLSSRKGSIEQGKDADLVLWDIDTPADLCYLTGISPVEMVVIGGEIRYTAR